MRDGLVELCDGSVKVRVAIEFFGVLIRVRSVEEKARGRRISFWAPSWGAFVAVAIQGHE